MVELQDPATQGACFGNPKVLKDDVRRIFEQILEQKKLYPLVN